jgi:SSS family transporter
MEAYRNLIVFTCVLGYMGLCVGVGIWAMRRTRSTRDFFMAGRNLGVFVTALAIFSSTLSGFGFVGGPGLVYRMGMSSVWMIITAGIGFCLSSFLLAKRLRLFAEVTDSVSLPDAVAARYGNNATRFLIAIAIVFGVVTYLSAQIMAMAVILQTILNDVDWLPEIGLVGAMSISCAVLVFYCVTGGIIASVYTDVVQGGIMVVAAVFVFFYALNAVDGGFAGITATLHADDAESIGPWGTLGIMGALSWYFLFALGGVGQPHIITKGMMVRSVKMARDILPVSIIGYMLAALLWISIGLAMRALVLQGDYPMLSNPDDAAPAFLQAYAPPLLAGVVFAGLFAAIMSTADGFLNIGVAAIVHDIPKSFGRKVFANELLWARILTVVIAIGAGAFAYFSAEELVALLGTIGWGLFATAIVPVVAIGFNWKRATALAANVTLATGLILFCMLEFGGINLPYGFNKGAFTLIIALTLFFWISLASKKKPVIDPSIARIMDL